MSSPSSANTITLPPFVPVAFMVFCSLPPAHLPGSDQLKTIGRAWIAANVSSPLRELTLSFLDQGMVGINVMPVTTLPAEMYHAMVSYMTPSQKVSLDRSTHVIVVNGQDIPIAPRAGLWTALATAIGCAAHFGAELIIDADTKSVVIPVVPFADYQVDYAPRAQYFVRCPHSHQPSDRRRYMTTIGLARYGLPEIQVEAIPVMNMDHLGWCIGGVSQVVAGMVIGAAARANPISKLEFPLETVLTARDMETAHGRVPETGPEASARVRLELKPGRYGQPENFITLAPPQDFTGDYPSWLHHFVASFFVPEQTMQARPIDDRNMEAASAHAVSTLPGVKARYQAGQIAANRVGVKYIFPTPDGIGEVMWIFVQSWIGDQITGELVNKPQAATDVRLGQSVTIREADVFDWMIMSPDGTTEGGFTDKVLHEAAANARQPEEDAKRDIPEFVRRRSDPEYVARVTAKAREEALAGVESKADIVRTVRKFVILKPVILGIAALALIKVSSIAALIVGAIGIWQFIGMLRFLPQLKADEAAPADLAKNGELRTAMIAMVNMEINNPGTSDAPALVIVLPNDDSDPVLLYDAVANGRTALRRGAAASAEAKAADKFLTDEGYVASARLRLPKELTNGAEIFAAHLMIERAGLRNGVLDEVFVPVLFVPGEKGAIGMISYKALDSVR